MNRKRFRVDATSWQDITTVPPVPYTCGYCGCRVASDKGWRNVDKGHTHRGTIFICPECGCPTIWVHPSHYPAPLPGSQVGKLPDDVSALYNEARECMAGGAFTAAVLVCRKLLMNTAVTQGATTNSSFVEYVDYLVSHGYIPPNGRQWVDYVRTRGNEANHEIELMAEADAKALMTFMEMLLRLVYEFPASVPAKQNP